MKENATVDGGIRHQRAATDKLREHKLRSIEGSAWCKRWRRQHRRYQLPQFGSAAWYKDGEVVGFDAGVGETVGGCVGGGQKSDGRAGDAVDLQYASKSVNGEEKTEIDV